MLTLQDPSLLLPEFHVINKSTDELGIVAKWWTSNQFPASITDVTLTHFFEVKKCGAYGEYFKRPEGTFGLIVVSRKSKTRVKCWRNENHEGLSVTLSEQEKDTIAFHFIGDAKIVYIGP